MRTGELRQATPDQFDLARGLWIIPPDVVKQLQLDMRKKRQQPTDIPPYIVPLSIQATEIVRHLLDEFKPAQRHLFRHDSDLKKRISENTLNGALKRMGYQERLTGHGIRGTMSHRAQRIGYPKVWVDSQLSHVDPNKVSATYNHAEYVEQRRRMMQDWADRWTSSSRTRSRRPACHSPCIWKAYPHFRASKPQTTLHAGSRRQSCSSRSQGDAMPMVSAAAHRLPAVPPPRSAAPLVPSDIQRERMELFDVFEAPHNLPCRCVCQDGRQVPQVDQLRDQGGQPAGVERGQPRPARAGLAPRPTQARTDPVRPEAEPGCGPWQIYHALLQPRSMLRGVRHWRA